ncbi:hypothetical protein O9992_01075 [Vibrio lentus]|nr:hypothetical protein [Vibrio lentus]
MEVKPATKSSSTSSYFTPSAPSSIREQSIDRWCLPFDPNQSQCKIVFINNRFTRYAPITGASSSTNWRHILLESSPSPSTATNIKWYG